MKYIKEKLLILIGLVIFPIIFAALTENVILSWIMSIVLILILYYIPVLIENKKLNKWIGDSYIARKVSLKFISNFCYIGFGLGILTLLFLIFKDYRFLLLVCSLFVFCFGWLSMMCLIMNHQIKKIKNKQND